LRVIAAAAGTPLIPDPKTNQITSFTSHIKAKERNGAAVGQATFQDIIDFCEGHIMTPERGIHEDCVIHYEYDCNRGSPFYTVAMSTRRLMTLTSLERGCEMDDSHKCSFRGDAITVDGQTDVGKRFYVRFCALSTHNTQEVGEIILEAVKELVPNWHPLQKHMLMLPKMCFLHWALL
jgi:hypothetical protein